MEAEVWALSPCPAWVTGVFPTQDSPILPGRSLRGCTGAARATIAGSLSEHLCTLHGLVLKPTFLSSLLAYPWLLPATGRWWLGRLLAEDCMPGAWCMGDICRPCLQVQCLLLQLNETVPIKRYLRLCALVTARLPVSG